MKKIVIVILALLMMTSLVSAKAKYILKFASVAPEGSTWMNIMEELNEEIMEKTDGNVEFKFYAGGVSGDEKDVLKKMRINQLNAAGFTSQGLGEVVPSTRILNLPLMLRTDEEVDYVMSKMAPAFEKEFEKEGYIVLGWPEVGFVYVLSTEKIESIDDLRKIKMWIWGDDKFVNSLFRNLGVVPIPLSLIDVMQSLQTGLIEGVYGSPLAAVATQWTTKVRYLLDKKIAHVPGGILVTKKQWDKIPADYQSIIKKESKKAFKKLTKMSRKENAEALDVMKSQGIKFTKIKDQADNKMFEEASAKTAEELVGKFYSRELLNELEGHLKDFRSSKK